MSAIKFPLNTKQEAAVIHNEGPLLVLAGAGSGKTRVLTQRIMRLIQEGVSPYRIFAVTFTNKAAKEMKDRVVRDLGPSANDLWISTFHSSCLRILRRHAEAIQYQKQFAIYDDTDQKTLIKKICASLNLSETLFKPQMVQFHINQAKNAGHTPDAFPTHGDFILGKVQEVYKIYQEELRRNQAMDFGDLILNALLLFRGHPEILAEYQNRFLYVMVDEYQDTNITQYQLIRALSDKWKNVFVVGDDDQSIYKFRGAEIRNILDFQKDFPNAKVVRLEQNYRSTQTILNAANAVIRGNKKRMGKELWTENNNGDLISLYCGPTDRDEARFVAEQIKTLRESYRLRDMAIFYRVNAQSRSLEDELRKAGIPHKIYGGTRFYDRQEIKDMLAYLRLLVNPADSVSLKRVINVPARGLGKTTLDKLDEAATRQGVSFWDVLTGGLGGFETHPYENDGLGLNTGTIQKLKSFVALIQKIKTALSEMPLDEFFPYLYEQTGYWNMLVQEKSIEAQGRQENLTEFVNVIDDYLQTAEEPSLEGFLDQVSLVSDLDGLTEDNDFVTLMTVHLAKGLEFDAVFIVGMEEGLFPHSRSLDQPDELEEERRLCYVGMTRAKKRLFLNLATERRLFGTPQYNFPSRFLKEMPEDLLDAIHHEHHGMGGRFPQKTNPSTRSIDFAYSQEDYPVRPGSRVRHAVFGDGKVESYEGQLENLKVTVRFQSGVQKKLIFKHAHLEVL
jgi:DNA helicase-2/ATP-dependent DNA helicase PcrA